MDPEQRALAALPVCGCNSMPRFSDRSQAIADRMRVISFPNVFRNTPQHDTSLPLQLEAELSGIFLWALHGYGELLASGSPVFPESESSAAIKAESIKASRPEELFCDECLVLTSNPNDYLSSEIVYSMIKGFCNRNGYKIMGKSFVIPEICRYLGVTKERISTPNGRKVCLIGVAFQQWVEDTYFM